jgi:hypothetical protein
MKAFRNGRMQTRKPRTVPRWGPKPKKYWAVLRHGHGHQVILDLPEVLSLGFVYRPGTRIWFIVLGSTLVVTGKPWGQRGARRYSSRLVRKHLPLRLLFQNREKRATAKGHRSGRRQAQLES